MFFLESIFQILNTEIKRKNKFFFDRYYQIPVVDGTGNVVQRLPIERSVRKSSNSGVASLFARLSFKKKSRADIVKLVASGDLVPAQLVQIKSAIEKGLTESQLVEAPPFTASFLLPFSSFISVSDFQYFI